MRLCRSWNEDETLISSDEDGAVLLWDVSDRRQFGSLRGKGGPPML
ncbi:MAG: hypothetical protein ACI8Y4_003521 [Candidatus Poriferisodalaceae bacterium]|jgi:hypothetical protein